MTTISLPPEEVPPDHSPGEVPAVSEPLNNWILDSGGVVGVPADSADDAAALDVGTAV